MLTLEEKGWHRATWTNGRSIKYGHWIYNWNARKFIILLDSYDNVTGRQRQVEVFGDIPEWGSWEITKIP